MECHMKVINGFCFVFVYKYDALMEKNVMLLKAGL